VFIEAKDDGGGGDNWTTGANITFHGLAYLKLTWASSNFGCDH